MVKIENLKVDLGSFVLGPLSFSVDKGEFFTIIGPTGSGKTVLLETIAGLNTPSQGRIILGGKDITHLPPEKRGISLVYQDFALFPHMSVFENIAYGLKIRRDRKVKEKVKKIAELLSIDHLLKRRPDTLSGGEKQRVSLARALVVDPPLLLMDEPFSSLDPRTRISLRRLSRELNIKLKKTFMMVTHDMEEALSLSDRIAVFKDGKLEQLGSPEEIVKSPKSPFVASLIGIKNLFPVRFKGRVAVTEKGLKIAVGEERSGKGFIAIGPDEIVISKDRPRSSARNVFKGIVKEVLRLGGYVEVLVDVSGEQFLVHLTEHSREELGIEKGKEVYLFFKALSVRIIS